MYGWNISLYVFCLHHIFQRLRTFTFVTFKFWFQLDVFIYYFRPFSMLDARICFEQRSPLVFAMMCTEYLSTFWYKYYLHFDIHINYLFVYWCSNSRRFNARVNSKAQFLSAYCNLVWLWFSFWTELLKLTIQITVRHRLRVSIVQLDYSDLSFPKFKICYNIRWNKQ